MLTEVELVTKLDHPRWQVRNQAIKAIGQVPSEESKQHLLATIKDDRPSGLIKRLLGEPFLQVGFIRRNAWTALQNQKIRTEEFLVILPIGLDDCYYEVRTATWHALDYMFKQQNWECPEELRLDLKARVMREKNFEIFLAMLPVLEHLMDNNEILSLAGKIRKFKPWRVRGSYFDLLCRLYENKRISYDEIKPHLNKVHLRSDYFKPIFLLKEKRQNLDKLLEVDR
jgi:hypothetical protein